MEDQKLLTSSGINIKFVNIEVIMGHRILK